MPDASHSQSPSDALLEGLAKNAIGFLNRSIDDLETRHANFSTIHFCQGLELFFKVRLWTEHWTLVLERVDSFDRSKFSRGDFKTVSFHAALKRIERVLGCAFKSTAQQAFEEVYKARNRAVHFFHEELPPHDSRPPLGHRTKHREKNPEPGEAAALHLRAWYELQGLLGGDWAEAFKPWAEEIAVLERRMREVNAYLRVRFERLQSEGRIVEGAEECPACHFRSMRSESIDEILTGDSCVVCELAVATLRLDCDQTGCGGMLCWTPDLEPQSRCTVCEHSHDLNSLADSLAMELSPGEPNGEDRGYCSECECYEAYGGTVVSCAGSEQYICLHCLERFERLHACGFCSELITDGDEFMTYSSGCLLCEGARGWERD